MRDFFYSLIFPHEKNNHRARVLHNRALFFIILVFFLSALFFPSGLNPFSEKLRAVADISVQELIDATNAKRKENGLLPLSSNVELSNAANKKAEDMFAKDYWAHNSPDGKTPWFFIKQSGYNYVYAGENLARGFSNANDVVSAWMASPSHKANLLSSNFKDVGFAVKSGKLNGEQTFLVVQELGSRSVAPVAKKPVSKAKARKVLGINFEPYLPLVPSLSLSSKFAILILGSLVLVLVTDILVIKRRKLTRFVGHNVDHILFLTTMAIVLGGLSTGVIV